MISSAEGNEMEFDNPEVFTAGLDELFRFGCVPDRKFKSSPPRGFQGELDPEGPELSCGDLNFLVGIDAPGEPGGKATGHALMPPRYRLVFQREALESRWGARLMRTP